MDKKNKTTLTGDSLEKDITASIDEKSENSNEEENKDYEFVTETIKRKPVNKKKLITRVAYSIGMGIIVGIVACIIIVVFAPKLDARLHPETVGIVSIPQDAQTEESLETTEASNVTSDSQTATNQDANTELNIDKVTDNTENSDGEELPSDDSVDGSKQSTDSQDNPTNDTTAGESPVKEETEVSEAEEPQKITEQIIITKDVTLDDYKTLYREMSNVANDARKSFAKVKGVTESTDWFNNSYESGNISTGLIVADNGKELLIITVATKLKDAKEIEVTFCDGKSYKGTIKKSDSNTSLVVVAVLLEELEDGTKNSYKYAELGNSTSSSLAGTPVLAVGSPLGIEDSVAVGLITSNNRTLEQTDSNIRYITTDIYGSTDGSGVLIDLDGKVLGIIFQGGTAVDTRNLVHAYSISDIKAKIEKLSNGQDIAYLGIVGTDVTKQAIDELGVPEGAYVKQVVVDSPAMKGGIQNGDVIVKLGTTDIKSFRDYEDAISKSQPGDATVITVKRLGKDGYVEFSYEIYLEALK